MERDSHWSDHTDQNNGQQPDQDPSLSTGSLDIGQQPDQDPYQSAGSMETGQQPEDRIGNHPFTLEGEPRTPENWPEIYSQYLEDSPSSRHSGTTLHQSPVRNSKKELETDRKLETMRRHADNFFNRTRVTNRPPSPETEVARRQRIRAETVVQEVRLRNFDDVLMDPRELFNQIGIVQDRDILAELVMGQYDLAKKNNNCSWLYEARRMAVLCLPENWVDTHLCRWNPGKPLISGRRKIKPPTSTVQSTSGMAKDRRVVVEGQDLPCLRTDAASTSQMDVQVVPVQDPWELVRADRPTSVNRRIGEAKEKEIRSISRSDERREETHRPSRSPIRSSRSQYGQQPGKSSRKSRPYSPVRAPHQDKGKGPVTSRAHKDASRQSTSRAGTSHSNREESRSIMLRRSRPSPVRAPPAENMVRKRPITDKMLVEPTAKKGRQSSRYQDCPVPRCGAVTNYMKDHVQSTHMPSLFVQLEPEDRALGNTHRQRLNGLTQLARSLLGPNATPYTLMNHVNSRLQDIIHAYAGIWVPLQLDMKALCKFARWQIPDKFEIFPQVNSPACLVYWRIFVYLLGQLPDSTREEFFQTYHQGQSPSCTTLHPRQPENICIVIDRAQQGSPGVNTIERVQITQAPSATSFQTTRQQSPPRSELRVPEHAELVQATSRPKRQSPPRNQPLVPQQGPPAAFDSHFHLDRTARELWGVNEVSTVTLNDILREPLAPAPNNPVTLIGGVIVFCDPGTTLSIPLMDGRWKVAVGLHPKSFNHDDAYLDQVRTLVQSNPLVAALGEIGLDRTVPDYLWDEQERTFQRLLTFCHPDKVLVLHLRGYSEVHSSDVLNTGLQYVRKACSRDQKIHLHCFTGRRVDVENWLEDFPNCHFGFTAKVSSFNDPQLEGLRSVPNDRILLETDSPYMPVSRHHRTNTPAYLGDIARMVAHHRFLSWEELLDITTTNGQRLYQ